MSLLTEIQKLKGKQILSGLLVFLGTISPGFLTIYHFRPELVEKYDFAKLLLFSASLTLPFLFVNTLAFAAALDEKDNPPAHGQALVFGALLNTFTLNSALAIAYFGNKSFAQMIAGEIVLTLTMAVSVARAASSYRKAVSKPKENA